MTGYSGTELPWTGGRPWMVLDNCPGETHNTLNAGRGRMRRRSPNQDWVVRRVPKCICPGSAHAIAEENAERAKRGRLERERGTRVARKTVSGAWVPNGTRQPDFSDAACRGPLGRRIMDGVINNSGGSNTRSVKLAKVMCASCPIRETLCRPYVLSAEQPAGAWYGVWAGMTQTERREARGLKR